MSKLAVRLSFLTHKPSSFFGVLAFVGFVAAGCGRTQSIPVDLNFQRALTQGTAEAGRGGLYDALYYNDVAPLIAEDCHKAGCHGPGMHPLDSLESLKRHQQKAITRLGSSDPAQLMPPQQPDYKTSARGLTLMAWFRNGVEFQTPLKYEDIAPIVQRDCHTAGCHSPTMHPLDSLESMIRHRAKAINQLQTEDPATLMPPQNLEYRNSPDAIKLISWLKGGVEFQLGLKFADIQSIITTDCHKAGCHSPTMHALDSLASMVRHREKALTRLGSADPALTMPPGDAKYVEGANGKKLVEWLKKGEEFLATDIAYADINKILQADCFAAGCHGPGTAHPLDTMDNLVKHAEKLATRLQSADAAVVMPPKKTGYKGTPNGRKLISWVLAGKDFRAAVTAASAPTYANIKAAIDTNCKTCHQPGGPAEAALVPLTTFDEVKAKCEDIKSFINGGNMPPSNTSFKTTADGAKILTTLADCTKFVEK